VSRTVAFATLGCRLNQVDTQEMQARFEARGFRTVLLDGVPSAPRDRADIVVVNSCTVTGRADVSDRQMVRRAMREHPGARVVVTGCWAQTDPQAALAAGADLVVGNAEKSRIAELLEHLLEESARSARREAVVSDIASVRDIPVAPLARRGGRSRAFLKVQEGCQHRCAFCIVPRARGNSRSQDPRIVVEQVERLVAEGHPEVVLTGVDLGHYGADLVPRTSLAALLGKVVAVRGLRWVRLSSILPAYVTAPLLDVITGSEVIAPHFHVPLQSGSDRVLRRMRRPYSVAMYRDIVERLTRAAPDAGLGTDIIVGFPGETDEDFEQTVSLVDALPFSYLHVFPYSERQGTEAASLGDRVHARTVTRRSRLLRQRSQAMASGFRRAMVGRTWDALVLETRDRGTGRLVALTGNYVEVVLDGGEELMRKIVTVRITGTGRERAMGALA
jgi:threonylcarbamoyladenosine tRNA methylthiotransferase MtaB